MEYMVPACSGIKIDVKKGQIITVVDLEGGQVVDFFAEAKDNQKEFLSAGVTVDCNESLCINEGDIIYTNLYNEMFEILSDDVGTHDLIHPCCRTEMYDFFYNNGKNHPNCLDNINQALGAKHSIITPINFFMNTKINADGSITVDAPVSKAGDKIVLKALKDVILGVAACSVSESNCNGGKCSPILIIID